MNRAATSAMNGKCTATRAMNGAARRVEGPVDQGCGVANLCITLLFSKAFVNVKIDAFEPLESP